MMDSPLVLETVSTAMDVRLIARYVGPNEDGAALYATMVGVLADGPIWRGIDLPAGKVVRIRVRNDGPEGDLRAVWLVSPILSPGAFAQGGDLGIGAAADDFDDEYTPAPEYDDDD